MTRQREQPREDPIVAAIERVLAAERDGSQPQLIDASPAAVDPSPEAKASAAAFRRLLWTAADLGTRGSNLHRLAREYRRTERRAKALEKVLLPEVEDAMKRIDEQLDAMDREESIRIRWSGKLRIGE